MHICPCSRALGICKNIGIRTYFGSMAIESVGVFRHFAFCSLENRLASFLIAPKNCFFWGASFELIKKLATLFPKNLQGFHWTLLYHCYTLTNNWQDHWQDYLTGSFVRGAQQNLRASFVFVRQDSIGCRAAKSRPATSRVFADHSSLRAKEHRDSKRSGFTMQWLRSVGSIKL